MFALRLLYIWLSWNIKDIKVAGLSLSEGWECVTAAKLSSLSNHGVGGGFLVEAAHFMTTQRLEIIVEANS